MTETDTVLLALDTSTEFCSAALLRVDETSGPGRGDTNDGNAHVRAWVCHERTGAVSSARLLPCIAGLLADAGLTLMDCDVIAFGAGPGAFTGLRTATGVAQGLAFGLNLPVVPVSTLLACAEHARQRDPLAERVLVALDARMDEVYWADFAWDARVQEWRVVQPASLDAPEQIIGPREPFTLAGNAAAVFGARVAATARARVIDTQALPHALPLAYAGLRAFRAGHAVRADQAAPDYVRNKVAQTTAERLLADGQLLPMTQNDLDDVMRIEQAACEFPWTRGNFEDALRSGYPGVCLRQRAGALMGYCVLMPVVDEMHLLNICVAPEVQRMGAGLALLREAARIAQGGKFGSLLLEVRVSNLRAIRLYQRFGFTLIGRRRNYYPARQQSREDALVMRLPFCAAGGADVV